MQNSVHVLLFYNDLMCIRRFARTIAYVQEIDAIRQTGNIELHHTAFGALIPQHITLSIVQTDIIHQILP